MTALCKSLSSLSFIYFHFAHLIQILLKSNQHIGSSTSCHHCTVKCPWHWLWILMCNLMYFTRAHIAAPRTVIILLVNNFLCVGEISTPIIMNTGKNYRAPLFSFENYLFSYSHILHTIRPITAMWEKFLRRYVGTHEWQLCISLAAVAMLLLLILFSPYIVGRS